MKCICVTGAIQSDLNLVFSILQQTGVELSQPNRRADSIDIAAWHEQALTLEISEADAGSTIVNPGRFMDQMASDIFIANIKAEAWGWADIRSTLLLDYWLNFDPRLNFVLVYVSPKQMLAGVMSTTTETISVDAIMAAWHSHYQQLLRFHLRNPQRSVLVDVNQCAENPQGLIDLCTRQWALQLPAYPANNQALTVSVDALAVYLAQQLCTDYTEVTSLTHEITATLAPLAVADPLTEATLPLSGEQLIKSYRALQDRSVEQDQIRQAQQELAIIKTLFSDATKLFEQEQRLAEKNNQQRLLQLQQVEAELKNHFQSSKQAQTQIDILQADIEVLSNESNIKADQADKKYNETVNNFTRQQQESEQENELLLLQLHQVQEELEANFLNNLSADKLCHTLQGELTNLTQVNQGHEAMIESLTKNHAQVVDGFAQRQKETGTQIEILQAGIVTRTGENDVKADQAVKKYNETVDNFTLQQQESAHEADLLLLQLHQVQEELEANFLNNLSADKLCHTLQGELTNLTQVNQGHEAMIESLTKNHAQVVDGFAQRQKETETQIGLLQAGIVTRTGENDVKTDQADKKYNETINNFTRQQQESEQKNELLFLQLQQVQKELDAGFLKSESVDKFCHTLQGELANLTKDRDSLDVSTNEHKSNLESLTKNHAQVVDSFTQRQNEADTLQKQTDQENQLLLLQLHQTQEELEHYFLQHQDKQSELQIKEARWQNMLQRHPDYCDYESIAVQPDENNDLIWQIKNLHTAGQSLPEITFKTFIEQDMAGFVFFRKPDHTGPFTRWPTTAANADELTIIPAGSDKLLQQRIEVLLDIASADWELIQTLINLLKTVLQEPQTLSLPADFNPAILGKALTTLNEVYNKCPALLRYDRPTLKREQINPGYEQLCLHFDRLTFAGKCWSDFEFRLSCANVHPNHFGAHPKLEFSEAIGQAIFEGWFIESYDDFGAKLELRFALPNLMDINVWQQLSTNDQALLTALIERLPAILESIKSSGTQLKRSWDDWLAMAKEMQRIVALQLTPQVPLVIAPAIESKKTVPTKAKITAPASLKKGPSFKVKDFQIGTAQ